MHANYELQLDDLHALMDLEKRRRKTSRLPLILAALLYAGVLIYAFAKLPLNSAILLLLPALVFAVTLVRAIRMTAPGRAMIKNHFCGTCQLKIEHDGVTEIRPTWELKRNWSAIDRLVKTNTHLFVYAAGLIAYVVPRRAFFDDADFDRFVKAIQDRSNVTVTTAAASKLGWGKR